ncbi:MAG: transporter substrate-binding domain-containing protein [Hyphomicrobiaceae bacterium]
MTACRYHRRNNRMTGTTMFGSFLAVLSAGMMCLLGLAPASTAQEAENIDPPPERRVIIRFVTEGEFPPFNFYDEDGVLTGFNIDLARAICLEVNVTCDIKVQPWGKLVATLKSGDADAIIAAQAVTAKALRDVDFSARYFHTPGRFVARRRGRKIDISREALVDRLIGVTAATAHEAYLRTFFGDARIKTYKTPVKTREALREGQVDVIFGDGISLAFWLNGTLSQQCCEFRGGAFLEPKFFGDGLAIAVRSGDDRLRSEINTGLERVRNSGRFRELVSRYFPFKIY